MKHHAEPTLLMECANPMEASVVAALLNDAGISAVVFDNAPPGMTGMLGFRPPARVMVPADQIEQARLLIASRTFVDFPMSPSGDREPAARSPQASQGVPSVTPRIAVTIWIAAVATPALVVEAHHRDLIVLSETVMATLITLVGFAFFAPILLAWMGRRKNTG